MVPDVLQSAIADPHFLIADLPMPNLARTDGLAMAILAGGVIAQLLHRRLPAGLGTSLFAAATTIGMAGTAFHHNWTDAQTSAEWAFVASHIAAALSLMWALFGWAASERRDARPAGETAALAPTPSATFFAWSLVSGILAVVLVMFPLALGFWQRVVNPLALTERMTPNGLWDIAALLAATGVWVVTARRPQQPVMLLVLSALMVGWTALMIPAGFGFGEHVPPLASGPRFIPVWWTWTLQLQCGLAGLILVAALLQDVPYRIRIGRAWPDHIEDFVAPYSCWGAYVQTESVLAAVILVLGVYQIVRPGPWDWQPKAAGIVASGVAGVTCLFLSYRRWSPNTAELGIALLTLSVVVFSTTLTALLALDDAGGEYVGRLPLLCNGALFGLAAMIALWHWLAGFWKQQLGTDGAAWTTAGRMIPPVRRGAFLITAMAALIAFQMALWPERVPSGYADNAPGRIAAGLAAIVLLVIVTARIARTTGSISSAALSVALMVAGVLFAFVRMRASAERGWLLQYSGVVLALGCLPILAVAEWIPGGRWRSFAPPMWFLALTILPACALWHVLPSDRLPSALGPWLPAGRIPAEWVRPMTLAILGAVYGLAANREHRRSFLVLAGVLLLGALASFYRAYWGG